MTLSEFLGLNTFHLVLTFCRVGSMMATMPGFSVSYLNVQARLFLAIGVTLVMAPVLGPGLPPLPGTVGALGLLVVTEVFYGIFLGLVGQAVMASIHLAGTSIGQNTGLMNAMVFDPVTESQGALVIGMLTTIALVSVFVMDLHHLMFHALYHSYTLFPVGQNPVAEDHLTSWLDILAKSFLLGLGMAMPFIVFGIVFQSSMGLMSRLSPQLNVFFVALPIQILFGLGVLWVTVPSLMMWFLRHLEDVLMTFTAG